MPSFAICGELPNRPSQPRIGDRMITAKRSRRLTLGMVLCLVCIFNSSCGPALGRYAGRLVVKAFEQALIDLMAQRLVALATYNEASIARSFAQIKVDMKFQSPETQSFIEQWRKADRETQELRQQFNRTQKAAGDLIGFLNEKAGTIRDNSLRERSQKLIGKKKVEFDRSLAASDQAIAALESSILTGNDIITALEIAGVLGGFEGKLLSLQEQNEEMIAKMPDMELMIDQGMDLIDLEFGTLGG